MTLQKESRTVVFKDDDGNDDFYFDFVIANPDGPVTESAQGNQFIYFYPDDWTGGGPPPATMGEDYVPPTLPDPPEDPPGPAPQNKGSTGGPYYTNPVGTSAGAPQRSRPPLIPIQPSIPWWWLSLENKMPRWSATPANAGAAKPYSY